MKYVIRAAPILVALTLFASFLVVQQSRPAQAAVAGLSLSTDFVSSNANVATTGRTVIVMVTDSGADAAPAGYVTVENDTKSITITGGTTADDFLMTETTPGSGVYVGEFIVTPEGSARTDTLEADDGDIIQVTAGFLFADMTVDSDPPNMNEDDMDPADGAISGDGLTPVSGKVTDNGAGIADDADIKVFVDGFEVPAALISFTEVVGGHSFDTFVNVTEGARFWHIEAMDGAGNVLFSDSDDTTDCVVTDTGGILADVGCDVTDFDVDETKPAFALALTGLAFDEDSKSCDVVTCTVDENKRDWILAVFTDAHDLDGSSIDAEDFTVEGANVTKAKWFDEDGMVDNVRKDGPWVIRKLVFLQLTSSLDADEKPDVFLVAQAGGVFDEALNINNFAEKASDDRIGPLFEVSNFLPAATSASLVGEDVEVTFTISSDEEVDGKPTVTASDVFSPGSDIGTTVSTAGTNRWSVVVDEVSADTATIYNIHVTGADVSGNAADLGIDNVDDKDPANLDDSDTPGVEEADGLVDGFFDTITDTDVCGAGGASTTSTCVSLSNVSVADINEDAIYFEGDTKDLAAPATVPLEGGFSDVRSPFFISLDFALEGSEFEEDDHAKVDLLTAELDGVDVLASASSADEVKWLIAVLDIALGDHELVINASDEAGNELTDGEFKLEFEVTERDPIKVALNPGWNLVSLPGQPADTSIDAVMAGNDASAVITYDPTIPGGFLVAIRDVGDSFSGTLKTMDASRGYWVLTDSFQPIEVDVPPLAAGSAGVLPPTVPIAKGWNLVPIQDPTGVFGAGTDLEASDYFTSAEDVSAVYFFDTIANAWEFVDITSADASVTVGKAYWVFSTAAGSLVPVPIEQDA